MKPNKERETNMIDLQQLDEHIAYAIGTQMEAKRVLFDAAEAVIARKIALADKEAELTAAGIDGKNAEERKAALYRLTAPERGMLELVEETERRTRYHAEIAQITLDGLRYRLRVAELMKESEK
jgi:hypothetical protein